MPKISKVHGREILDSRGNPTVFVSVILSDGARGDAATPSGASTGIYEALELRDNDKKRYFGKGVLNAVKNVNTKIAKSIIGMDINNLRSIDKKMIFLDGTDNKKKLGANAILGVSLACARAGAVSAGKPLYAYLKEIYGLGARAGVGVGAKARFSLPYPMMNIINGGAHADWAIDIQECMIVPKLKTLSARVRCGAEIFHALGSMLKEKGYSTMKGDEGGYSVKFKRNDEAFAWLVKAIQKAGYKPGVDVSLAIDVAASQFYDKKTGNYILRRDKQKLSSGELMKIYKSWISKYPIISIEDPFDENDWEAWIKFNKEIGKKIMIVGDDLFVTQAARLQIGLERKAANAILIKPNQVGSLSETIDTILLAQKNGYKVCVSHRSGETEDTTIADLSVAVGSEYIKTGSLSRSERVAKYNRLLEIESEFHN